MKTQNSVLILCSLILFPLFLSTGSVAQSKERQSKYACMEPQPEQLCNASNTCGSSSTTCTVDVKRTADSASVTPGIPGAKGNALFCVKVGTTVTWQTPSKNVGFLVDFGDDSPFEPQDTITGGFKNPVTVIAKKPGCFKFTAGACASGATYGVCKEATTEAVVLDGSN